MIRLASTAKPSPLTRPAAMHASTTRSNTCRKISLSRKRPLRARENAEWSGMGSSMVRPQKPAVRQVHLHLAAQQSFRADGEYIAEDEHPDHEHRIDRRPAGRGIIGRELGMNPRQIENSSDLASAVVVGHCLIEAERIEQLPLIPVEPPHHREPPPPPSPHRR